jgi:transposase
VDGDVVESTAASAHTSDRMSARTEFVEVVTRGERRRRWSVEQKLRIVAEAMQPGVVAKEVAQREGIGTGLLYTWRRDILAGIASGPAAPRLPSVTEGATAALPVVDASSAVAVPGPALRPGRIEITLPGGALVRVDADVDGAALRRVFAALEGR